MNKEDIKAGDRVLWAPEDWPTNPLQRIVTEVRETGVYIEKGTPRGRVVPYADIKPFHTDFAYLKYPVGKQ